MAQWDIYRAMKFVRDTVKTCFTKVPCLIAHKDVLGHLFRVNLQ